MTIKKSCIIAAVVTTIGMASAAEESKASGFDLTGNIQTQAYKAFYDNEKENTLDNFWFRANIGGTYSSENFDAKVTIRMYAPHFNGGADKFQADTYYGNYKWATSGLNLKLGHWKTDTEGAGNFGGYLDQNLSKRGFLVRDYAHDAFELGWKMAGNQLNVMVGTDDGNFNKGYLRVNDDLKLGEALKLGLGYRANVLDPMQYSAVLTHVVDFRARYQGSKQLAVYAEAAAIMTGEDDEVNAASIEAGTAVKPLYGQDTQYFPVYGGVEFPTGGIFDKAFAEVEYVANRDELNADADELGWAVGLVKKIGSHGKIQATVYSENKMSDVGFSARLTTTIK
ncbi:hypothetical protein [Fibrobacter sp.]|uniref:hypothetical protein n=1 Tax=Fibrobacter sp. TaxID=35828 RepID=UPI00388F9F29